MPKLLSVASPKSNSLLVSWSSVDQRTADLFYEVKAYDILDTSKPKDFCYVSAKTSSASCKMTNLNPNTKYNVSIGAYRIGGPNNSNHEDVLYARTRPACKCVRLPFLVFYKNMRVAKAVFCTKCLQSNQFIKDWR